MRLYWKACMTLFILTAAAFWTLGQVDRIQQAIPPVELTFVFPLLVTCLAVMFCWMLPE